MNADVYPAVTGSAEPVTAGNKSSFAGYVILEFHLSKTEEYEDKGTATLIFAIDNFLI